MRFRIVNRLSGVDLGAYGADSKAGALESMARDAGYRSYSALVASIGGATADELLITADQETP